jgi:hypothetical protein
MNSSKYQIVGQVRPQRQHQKLSDTFEHVLNFTCPIYTVTHFLPNFLLVGCDIKPIRTSHPYGSRPAPVTVFKSPASGLGTLLLRSSGYSMKTLVIFKLEGSGVNYVR